jgi:CRISPR/Cas system-associated exonuclease Cas4 (RecB family)
MANIKDLVPTTAQAIFAGYEKAADDHAEQHRPHLGASIIGKECAREVWLTWRWAESEQFEGRMLRLFQTGHIEEPRLVADLRRIGVEVHDTAPDGSQWRVAAVGGHFGGSLDGACLGIVEGPKTWHVLECKTGNARNHAKMVKEGVQKAKPQHYIQMQVYMGLTGMTRALYLMKNKDNDDIHSERVRFDKPLFERTMALAERLVRATEPPEKLSQDPSYYLCKFCKFHSQCHKDQVPEVNCRTCAHSTPDVHGSDGRWHCNVPSQPDGGGAGVTIPLDVQRIGCGEHRFIPIFIERTAKPVDYYEGAVVYETPKGERFANGDGTNGTFTSQEIRDIGIKDALPTFTPVRAEVPGSRVVPAEAMA